MPARKGTRYPLSNFLSFDQLFASHRSFIASISTSMEPATFAQADQDSKWREVMNFEILVLEQNNTWTLTPCPMGRSLLAASGYTK